MDELFFAFINISGFVMMVISVLLILFVFYLIYDEFFRGR